MKTIVIKTQQSDKNGICVYCSYSRTKDNPSGLLFARATDKGNLKLLNNAIKTVMNSVVLCDKFNITTEKKFKDIMNEIHNKIEADLLEKYIITKKDRIKYYKNNIKLKFEIKKPKDFEFEC